MKNIFLLPIMTILIFYLFLLTNCDLFEKPVKLDGSINEIYTIPRNGLVAEYLFDGTADDTSGNGLNGTVHGASLTTDRNGINNAAYYFNGLNNYINFGNGTIFNFDSYTFSLWLKLDVIPTDDYKGIITKNLNTGFNNEIMVSIQYTGNPSNTTPGSIGYSIGNNIDQIIGTGSNISLCDNKWHNIITMKQFNVSGDSIYLYIDGTFASKKNLTFNGTKNNYDLVIGRLSDDAPSSRYYKGILDDVRIYNRGLSDYEIKSLYKK